MKNKKLKLALGGIISVLVLMFTSFIFIKNTVRSADLRMRKILAKHYQWVEGNMTDLNQIFEQVYPLAQECAQKGTVPTTFESYKDNCDGQVRSLIDKNFHQLLSSDPITRKPLYFIRLKDSQHIEKLFQSGVYFVETVDTPEEKQVVEMLQGTRYPFEYPLYTCCGGDDFLEMVWYLPSRVYLKDLQTEIEFIIPVYDKHRDSVGTVVYLYGD